MAVTQISTTQNLRAAVKYITNDKPHHEAKDLHKRVLDKICINSPTDDPNGFVQCGMHTLHTCPNYHTGSIQAIRKIISFDPKKLSYKNYDDRNMALKIAYRATKRQFPLNQSLIVLQADNKNHILHAHICTVARNIINKKSSTPKATWRKSVKYTDEATKHFGFTPSTKPTRSKKITNNSPIKIHQRHEYSYIFDLRNRIDKALKKSNNILDYASNLSSNGVSFCGFKTSRKLGKQLNKSLGSAITVYPTPKGKASNNIPVSNGYLRLRKHFSYKFKAKNGKVITIRHGKLGSDTDRPNVMRTLNLNRHELIDKRKITSTINSIAHPKAHPLPKITLTDLHPVNVIKSVKDYELKPTDNFDYKGKKYHKPIKIINRNFRYHHYHPRSKSISNLINHFQLALSSISRNENRQLAMAKVTNLRQHFTDKAQEEIDKNHDDYQKYLEAEQNEAANRNQYQQSLIAWRAYERMEKKPKPRPTVKPIHLSSYDYQKLAKKRWQQNHPHRDGGGMSL